MLKSVAVFSHGKAVYGGKAREEEVTGALRGYPTLVYSDFPGYRLGKDGKVYNANNEVIITMTWKILK